MFQYMSRRTQHLIELNLFKSGSTDEQILTKERKSTRIYLLLFIITFVILTTYTSLATETVQVTVINPSLSTYRYLRKEYSTAMKCFCSRMAVKYEDFMHIDIEYHQVLRMKSCSKTFDCLCS